MPFVSQKQRGLFYAAKHSTGVRKAHGLSKDDVDRMISHDEGGKLSNRVMKSLSKARKKREK